MSIYLICLTTKGGLPILTRRKGNCENLPFSTIASLNGLHMYFRSLGVSLYSTYASNYTYLWRDYFNTITVIVCSYGISDLTTEIVPDIIFGAFSLFISRDEMSHQSLEERLKKESKNYTRLIDAILESCLNQFLSFSNCLLSTENYQALQCLNEEFSLQCGSVFCCLVVGFKIAVATDGWWDLDVVERQLLLLLLKTSRSLQNDIVVYLPKKSPNIAYRFITVSVSTTSVLCVICGAEPSLKSLHDVAKNTFQGESSMIQNMERSLLRGLSEYIEIYSAIEAIIVANIKTRKIVFASNIHHSISTPRYAAEIHHINVFRKFFCDTVLSAAFVNRRLSTTSNMFEVCCQFCSLDTHKCVSEFDVNDNAICLLFTSSLPIHTMKYIGKYVFDRIRREKYICW